MPPAALSTVFCDADDIKALLSEQAVELRLDDDGDGVVATFEGDLTRARSYATSRVRWYLAAYDPAELATSWLVNEWAVRLAARWLCARRCNPVPQSIEDLYEEAIDDMEKVRSHGYPLPDVATLAAGWPTWSNVRVDPRYRVKQIRVERPISERESRSSSTARDRASEMIGPSEDW